MKRYFILTLIGFFSIFGVSVDACGEIKDLKSSVGTVTTVNESTYLITVPTDTREVTLEGSANGKWVEGYGPRKLVVGDTAELKVDGFDCGFGIYTYFVKFKTISNLIAENDPVEPSQEPVTPPITSINQEGTLPLTKLEIKEVNIDFDPSIRNYSVSVDNKVSSLNITAESQDPTVTITVSDNASSLEEGENKITITLEDSFGNYGKYTVAVTREKAKSSNNFLASITIENHQLNFDTSITSYDLVIGKEKILNVSAVTASEKASFVILGNNDLKNSSIVTIRVTAEDKSVRDYTINIVKKFNVIDYWLYIVIALLVLLLIILMLISKKQKNTKKRVGPAVIAPEENTAGVVQEIASQNGVLSSTETDSATMTPTGEVQTGTLQIIEPTNIEVPQEEVQTENDDKTEVFQL